MWLTGLGHFWRALDEGSYSGHGAGHGVARVRAYCRPSRGRAGTRYRIGRPDLRFDLGTKQQGVRNRDAQTLRRLEVDDQLQLRGSSMGKSPGRLPCSAARLQEVRGTRTGFMCADAVAAIAFARRGANRQTSATTPSNPYAFLRPFHACVTATTLEFQPRRCYVAILQFAQGPSCSMSP